MSIFDLIAKHLTKTGVASPDGTDWYDSPTDAAKSFATKEMKAVQPSIDQPSNVQLPDADGAGGSDAYTQQQEEPSALMRLVNPSFAEASTGANGQQTANSPKLTKKGALMSLVLGAGRGALDGLAANADTYARTGRNGGFGGGYEGAIEMPIQRQRGKLENMVLSAQANKEQAQADQMQRLVTMPNGVTLPFAMAQHIYPTVLSEQGKNARNTENVQYREAIATAKNLIDKYKPQNGVLVDVTTGKPLTPNAAGLVETPPDLAAALHVEPKTMLPAKLLTEARSAAYGHLASADPIVVAQLGEPPVGDPTGLAEWGRKAEAIKIRMSAAPRLEMTLARPVQVADENSPGNTKYVTAGQAMKTGAAGTQSASLQVAKAAAKSELPTNIGNQKLAFNTAIAHADLLKDAIKALNNGDQTTLNSLKNRLKAEFGVSGPVTAQAIADAYTRETTKMLSAGHLTDSEIGTVGSTLNVNRQSPQQSLGVIAAYRALAQSKVQQLDKQKNAAISSAQGKNKPAAQPSAAPAVQGHSDLGFVPASQ